MSQVFTTNGYLLVNKRTNKPYRSVLLNDVVLVATRQEARDYKRQVEDFSADTYKIAKVKSRFIVEDYVR